jgi:hypothetical protein
MMIRWDYSLCDYAAAAYGDMHSFSKRDLGIYISSSWVVIVIGVLGVVFEV